MSYQPSERHLRMKEALGKPQTRGAKVSRALQGNARGKSVPVARRLVPEGEKFGTVILPEVRK